MNAQEIKELGATKIATINKKVADLGNSMQAKVMKHKDPYTWKISIVIVFRAALLKHVGCAQTAFHYGKENIDYKVFKTPTAAANYIKKNFA